MTEDTKSLLKFLTLGLVTGSSLSALRAAKNNKTEDDKEEKRDNEIVVPLSRKNFMSAVRGKPKAESSAKADPASAVVQKKDVAGLAPRDLDALKRSILMGKQGSCEVSKTGPVSQEILLRGDGKGGLSTRDSKGRFARTKAAADMWDVVPTGLSDALGFYAGSLVGVAAMKKIGDKILVEREKKRVERARRRYADALNREVEDVDTPYYTRKTASDRSTLSNILGLVGTYGVGVGGLSGLISYKILNNRRLAEESRMDKDLKKYPMDKTIRFQFSPDDAPSGKDTKSHKSEKKASSFFG